MSLSLFGDFAGNVVGWQNEQEVTEWIERINNFIDQ
jgi:hypothetical protein